MPKRTSTFPSMVVDLNRLSPVPLHRQLYDELREAILSRRLKTGTRLPSTREFTAELGVSRTTVLNAFRQLRAEGYIESKVGAGSYVTGALPDELLRVRASREGMSQAVSKHRNFSNRGALLADAQVTVARDRGKPRAFRPNVPALDAFPLCIWSRLVSQHWRFPSHELLGYGEPAGYYPLRKQIAEYLGTARAVRCETKQVIIVSGAQQALDIAARVLLDPDDAAWVEDPGYLGARGALLGAGISLVPVPVDEEGLNVDVGIARNADARLAFVTPSYQHPLGATMSLARRLALLEWASRSGAWIVEDDYNSEYRYAGRPLSALQGLDTEGRVIYVGTFSKVLFPSLRLGYIIAPPDLVEPFTSARSILGRHSPLLEQAVVADFMYEGHFVRHIRRMRLLYEERQRALVNAADREFGELLEVRSAEAGMNLVGWLPEGSDDYAASERAGTYGLEAPPLSSYFIEPPRRGGLLLGYACVGTEEIREGVRRLALALRSTGVLEDRR